MKYWQKKVTTKDKRRARDFCRAFEIKISFTKDDNCADVFNNHIYVSLDANLSGFWSAVAHEVVHVLSYRQGKHKFFHGYKPRGMSTREYNRRMRYIGLKAELYVDKKAEQLINALMPTMPYEKGYASKRDKKWLKNWLKENYPPK